MIDWTYMPHIYFFSGAFSSLQSVLLYLITMIRFPIDATLRFCEYVTMALTDIFFFIASIWALSITFNIPNTADRMPIILSFIVYVIQFDIMLCYDAHTSFARQTDELSQFLFLSLSLYLSCVCVCMHYWSRVHRFTQFIVCQVVFFQIQANQTHELPKCE